MPGICCIATPASSTIAPLLVGMLRTMQHHPGYVTVSASDPRGVGLGRVALPRPASGAQPVWSEDRAWAVLMDGELFERPHTSGSPTSDAEVLLAGYLQEGQAFFRRLNGRFSAVLWDARQQQVILVSDRLGLRPLYYVAQSDRLLAASELKALVVDPTTSRRINGTALCQFLAFGQYCGDETYLEAVRVLPAAAWLVYDLREKRVTLERYWRPPGTLDTRLSEAEALERLDRTFKQAVDRQAAGAQRLGLSLSGGLDSRTILAVLDREKTPVITMTLGVRGCADQRSAQQMAALAGSDHHCEVLDERFLADFETHLRHMVRLTDGQFVSECIVMPTLARYRELGIDVLLRGHGGELMHMAKAYNFSIDRGALALSSQADLEAWLTRRLHLHILADLDRPLLVPSLCRSMDEVAHERVHQMVEETAHVEPLLQRVWHLFLSQRLRRETTLSLAKFGSVAEVRNPYLDHELVELLLTLPPQWKLHERMQAHILQRRMPAFLKVMNVNTGTHVGASRLAQHVATFRARVLAKLHVPGYGHYERMGTWLRQQLRPVVEGILLSPRCLERGIFLPDTVRAVVREHVENGRNRTFLLLALMIFELGQRQVIDGEDLERSEPIPRPVLASNDLQTP